MRTWKIEKFAKVLGLSVEEYSAVRYAARKRLAKRLAK